jgi:hypothetical protein
MEKMLLYLGELEIEKLKNTSVRLQVYQIQILNPMLDQKEENSKEQEEEEDQEREVCINRIVIWKR